MTQLQSLCIMVFAKTTLRGSDAMSHYKHFTIDERESILSFLSEGLSIAEIGRRLGRHRSSVLRELNRNCTYRKCYRPSKATKRYEKERRGSRRHKLLDDPVLKERVRVLFEEHKWSPEQIANRINEEDGRHVISYPTIYRAIKAGMFDTNGHLAKVKLRHKGKKRRAKGQEKRGKIRVSRELSERPQAANQRERIGDWEADTVQGKLGRACLVTMVDRKSRYLLCEKSSHSRSEQIEKAMIRMLKGEPAYTVTPDRGKEFATYENVEKKTNVEFYFPYPAHPWDRGTNENTNGLLREYFPKRHDLNKVTKQEIAYAIAELNLRPRKVLGWKTPYEVYHGLVLHLT